MSLPDYPYPGLRPFDKKDAKVFFGRGRQVAAMLRELESHRFLAVVGSSGSGKSSLVRAGLRPALEQGYLSTEGRGWRVIVTRPKGDPFASLATAFFLTMNERQPCAAEQSLEEAQMRRGRNALVDAVRQQKLGRETNTLLVIDQFEEIFRFHDDQGDVRPWERSATERETLYRKRNDAAAFVNLLLASAGQQEVPIYVVLTMRSDYIGNCDIFHGLPEALSKAQFLTPRLTREQCRESIEGPLTFYNGRISEKLVIEILNEMGSNPDQLPLMQHMLSRMWSLANEAKPGPAEQEVLLTTHHHDEVGGFQEALSNHADKTFDTLGPEGGPERRIAEVMFRCLSNRNPQGRLTRRPSKVSEISAVAGVPCEEVLEVARHFLAPGRTFIYHSSKGADLREDSTLDITHEALLRRWGRIADPKEGWAIAEFNSSQTYLDLVRAARRHAKGDGDLWDGRDLKRGMDWKQQQEPTEAWAERYDPNLKAALAFLARSKAIANLKRGIVAAVAGLALLAAAAWGWATIAEKQRAAAKDLAAAQEEKKHKERSLRLERALTHINEGRIQEGVASYYHAMEVTDLSLPEHKSLRRLIGVWSREIGHPIMHDGPVVGIGFSPDGLTLLTVSDVYSPQSEQDSGKPSTATAQGELTELRVLSFWDVRNVAHPRLLASERFARKQFAPAVTGGQSWVFTKDGSFRFVAEAGDAEGTADASRGSASFMVRTISRSGRELRSESLPLAAPEFSKVEGSRTRVQFSWSPEGSKLLAQTTISPPSTRRRVPDPPAGRLAVWSIPTRTGSPAGPLHPILAKSADPFPPSLRTEGGARTSVPLLHAFDPAGERLVVANIVADRESGARTKILQGDRVLGADRVPVKPLLASSHLRVYDLRPAASGDPVASAEYSIFGEAYAAGMALSPDGSHLAISWRKPSDPAGLKGSQPTKQEPVAEKDPPPPRPIRIGDPELVRPGPRGENPDKAKPRLDDRWQAGTEILTLQDGTTLQGKWFYPTDQPSTVMAFDPSGESLWQSSPGGASSTSRIVRRLRLASISKGVFRNMMARSPLAIESEFGRPQKDAYLVTDHQDHKQEVTSIAFDPDSSLVVTGSKDWNAVLEDPDFHDNRRLVHSSEVTAVKFQPGGAYLATASNDWTVRLWLKTSGRADRLVRLENPDYHLDPNGSLVSFAHDGKSLLNTHIDLEPREESEGPVEFAAVWFPFPDTGESVSFDLLKGKWPASIEDDQMADELTLSFGSSTAEKVEPAFFSIGSTFGPVFFWKASDRSPMGPPLDAKLASLFVSLSPSGERLLTSGFGAQVILWDLDSRQPLLVFNARDGAKETLLSRDAMETRKLEDSLTTVAFDPTRENRFVTAGPDGQVRGWEFDEGKLTMKWDFRHPTSQSEWNDFDFVQVALGANGRGVSTGSGGTVMLWDAESGQILNGRLTPIYTELSMAAFDASGETLLTWGADDLAQTEAEGVQLWDVTTQQPLGSRIPQLLSQPALRPDGKSIVVCEDHEADFGTGPPRNRLTPSPSSASEPDSDPESPDSYSRDWNPVMKIYKVPEPAPADLERLELFVKCLTGRTINEEGEIEHISQQEWRKAMDDWKDLSRKSR